VRVRFFTRRRFEKLVRSCGLRIRQQDTVGSPIDARTRRTTSPIGRIAGLCARADRRASRTWPPLFGYQSLYELEAA
jgi:hypothetical protein